MLLAYISCLRILRFDIIALLFMGPTYPAKNRGPEVLFIALQNILIISISDDGDWFDSRPAI
jgi:hypothetical protein